MKFTRLGVLAASAVLVFAACSSGATTAPAGGESPAASKGTIKIGVELPLSGGEAPNGGPTLKGVELAVKQANANGGIGGYTLETSVKDDAVNGVHDPQQGATNVQALAADPAVVGIVGPFNSNVGKAEIPVSNEAGLLQCSPANTNPGLTKPEFGALDVRKAFPDRINYIRIATTDDIQGPGGAQYGYTVLGKRNVFIIDDTETFGKGVADAFQTEWEKLGGTVVDRQGVPKSTTDYTAILTAAKAKNPDVVYFGGVTTTGGALIRKQMAGVGMGDLPYIGPDGIVDGSGGTEGSFINLGGSEAANSYGSVATIDKSSLPGSFNDDYKAEYGEDPGAYSGAAYACTQVILQSLAAVADKATDMAGLREAVRAYATDTSHTFDTVVGTTSFDANGDNNQKIISFYKVDLSAADGKGDWVFDKAIDYGTAQ